MSALELPGEHVAEPPFDERHDASEEEEPDSPTRSPESNSRSFSDWPSVEPVINQMLEVLRHANLAHKSVFIAIHARELANVRENVVEAVSQLECLDVSQPVLHVRVNDQLGQPQNFSD